MRTTVIALHAEAPPKPPEGAACNGCGVCCAASPCPPGILASRRLHGRCAALTWHAAQGRYRCGLVATPARWLPAGLAVVAPLVSRLARRFIAAGVGCDCSLEPSASAGGPVSG